MMTINNYNDGYNNTILNKLKFEVTNEKSKLQKLKKTMKGFSSINNSKNKGKIYSLRLKNYGIALPLLSNRTNNSNINNEEMINCKPRRKDINNLNIRRQLNDLYYFYHPWLNNSLNKNEIHSFMSSCYDITKIDAPINDKKYKIKENKLVNKNKYICDIEKNKKVSSILQKKKCNNFKFFLDIKKINNMDTIGKGKNYLNITNKNDFKRLNANENHKKFMSGLNSHIYNDNSLENSHSISPIKYIQKKMDNSKNITFFKDFLNIKKTKNFSSSLSSSCSDVGSIVPNDYKNNIPSKESIEVDNIKNIKLNHNYRTIKIKKVKKKPKNDRNDDKFNKIDKIKSNLLFTKNITFSSLNINKNNDNNNNNNNFIFYDNNNDNENNIINNNNNDNNNANSFNNNDSNNNCINNNDINKYDDTDYAK